VSLLFCGLAAQAAPVPVSYDFLSTAPVVTDPGSGPDGRGNVWEFTDNGVIIEATAWADSGVGALDQTATLLQFGGGIGSCNEADGSLSKCSSDPKKGAIDNGGGYDWILLTFSEVVDLGSFTLASDGSQDKDITYWAGVITASTDVSGLTYAELDILFGTRVTVDYAKSTASETVTIVDEFGAPVQGNAILIGTSLTSGGDRFGIAGTAATTVPVPAATWLFGSALGMLIFVRRRALA
jgi:hypothetical protein